MGIIQRALLLDRESYFAKHLEIVNCLLSAGLTPGEVRVLAAFMALPRGGAEGGMFGTANRRAVARGLGMGANGVGNHIASLLRKGALERAAGGEIAVRAFLLPAEGAQGYRIRLEAKG